MDRLRVPPPVPTLDVALLIEIPSGGVPSLLIAKWSSIRREGGKGEGEKDRE